MPTIGRNNKDLETNTEISTYPDFGVKSSIGKYRSSSPNMIKQKVVLGRQKQIPKTKKTVYNFREQNLNKYHALMNQALKMTQTQFTNTDSQRILTAGSQFSGPMRGIKKSSSQRFVNKRGIKYSGSSNSNKIQNQFKGRRKPNRKNVMEIMKRRSVETRQSGRNKYQFNLN